MSNIENKKIKDLFQLDFIIPAYQRGYRWSKINVQQMIQDILENINNKSSSYSLQPLTIFHNKDKYNVIDGQQRLTTILIIIAAIKYLSKKYSNTNINIDCFTLEYETREGSEFFLNFLLSMSPKEIVLESESAWKEIWAVFNNDEKHNNIKENIDFRYMVQAFVVAKENLEELNHKSEFSYKNMCDYICEKCEFIWYPLNLDVTTEEKLFYTLNMGKISLSNSELIKSELMRPEELEKDNDYMKRTTLLADKWYGIEKELRNPDFWAFVPHKNQYGVWNNEKRNFEERNTCLPRIDEIFQLVLLQQEGWDEEKMEKGQYDKLFIYNQLTKWLKSANCWMEVEELFSNIKELYNADGRTTAYQDYFKQNIEQSNKNYKEDTLYNLIGYIIYTYSIVLEKSEYSSGQFVLDLLGNNRNDRRTFLKAKIKNSLCEVLKIDRNNFNKKSFEEALNAIHYIEDRKQNSDTVDEKKDKNKVVKSILLLFNIILLDKNPGISSRYDFLKYKYWTVEHIFSKKEKELRDDDEKLEKLNIELNELREKLKKYKETIIEKNKNNISNINIKTTKKEIETIKGKLEQKQKINIEKKENKTNQKSKEIEKLFDSEKMLVIRKEIMENVVNNIDNIKNLSPFHKDRVKLIVQLISHIERLSNEDKKIEWEELIEDNTIKKYQYDIFKSILEENKDANGCIDKLLSEWEDKKSNMDEFIAKIQNDFVLKELLLQIGFFHKNENENLKNILTNVQTQNEVEVLYYKNDIRAINKEGMIENFKTVGSQKNKKVLKEIYIKEVNQYFKEEHNKILKDDTIKNLALLRNMENRSIENSFIHKKEKINEFISTGTVIPYSTLLVFLDRYTNLYNLGNAEKFQWLPSSRDKYFEDILDTIINFMEEKK